jgi:hypothetical protein
LLVGVATEMRLVKSLEIVLICWVDPTSIVGALATTVTSSAVTVVGSISAFTRRVTPDVMLMPSRETVLYPSFSNRRAYAPDGRSGMRKKPCASVTTTCSPCRSGDVAVTTTSVRGFLS